MERAAGVRAEAHPAELGDLPGREVGHERRGQRVADEGKPDERPEAGDLVADGVCDRLLAAPSCQVVVRRVVLVRANPRVDERAPAVHVLRPLREAPALPVVSQRAGLYGQSNLFERIGLGTFTSITAERVDQLAEAVEVEDDDVMDRQAGQRSHGRDA